MLYIAYEVQSGLLSPLRLLAQEVDSLLCRQRPQRAAVLRKIAAACELIARLRLTHSRPAFGIDSVMVGARRVPISEETVLSLPFGTLLHFRKDPAAAVPPQPPVLLAAPLSGHFATLLRETVRTMLQDHDVYITDWHNARDVPVTHGDFGLDDYIGYLMRFIATVGPGCHLIAVCQPCVAALAAAALMAEDDHPAQPRSLTLMAGPVDCRVNPTEVNRLATSKPLGWFERNLISRVTPPHAGFLRRVYPGFLQLSAFMSMNLERHQQSFRQMLELLAEGRTEEARPIQDFYDEYLAVNDLPAEFYLETVDKVFQAHALARGKLTWNWRRVDPAAIRRTALMTVEGERDDICAVGQTVAAQDLCSNVRPYLKTHHIQTGVGHYGVFSGRKWNEQIYPRVRDVIYASAA
ncbi:MAG TPA: polyhydroxyalkanoate depolymerase [Burkholderiaceae bacterium]|nr:polyhydroxyalkanoate depolymerase [Burkholderiaceae bacterium]